MPKQKMPHEMHLNADDHDHNISFWSLRLFSTNILSYNHGFEDSYLLKNLPRIRKRISFRYQEYDRTKCQMHEQLELVGNS